MCESKNPDGSDYEQLQPELEKELKKELEKDTNFAALSFFGLLTIDTRILTPASTDFRRVVLPSFITKTVGRLLWLHHVISPNILSSAFLVSNAIAGAYIVAISSSLEFLLRLWELKGSKDKNLEEKMWSAASIALKTAVKFFCVYMSWVLGTVAMTSLGVMAGPYLVLGMLGVGVATAIGLGFATVLTEVIPVLWKPLFKQYAIEFMKNCKIEVSDKKTVELFFEQVCEKYSAYTKSQQDNGIKPKTLDELLLKILVDKVDKVDKNDNVVQKTITEQMIDDDKKKDFDKNHNDLIKILKEKGFDLTDIKDRTELEKIISKKGTLDFSPVYKSFLRGFCEGLCWSYLEHFLNEQHLNKILDAVIVSVVVSTSFLLGGCLDSIWWRKDFSNRFCWSEKGKELKKQIDPIKERLKNIIQKQDGEITPEDVLKVLRLSNRINNTKFKNEVLKWIKQIVALKNSDNNSSNPQSPTLSQENTKSDIKWEDIKQLIDKPRPEYPMGFLFYKTNTSKVSSLDKNNQLQASFQKTKESIFTVTK